MKRRLPLPERVLARIQRIVAEQGFTHEALAPHLGISASAVSKLLAGKNAIGLDHLDGFCTAFQMTPAEIVLEPDSLIQPLTPMEASMLKYFRAMTDVQRHGMLAILDRSAQEPRSTRRARLGRAELTEEQQLLVDLYARSPEQAQSGILKTLRGTARLGDEERGRRRTTG